MEDYHDYGYEFPDEEADACDYHQADVFWRDAARQDAASARPVEETARVYTEREIWIDAPPWAEIHTIRVKDGRGSFWGGCIPRAYHDGIWAADGRHAPDGLGLHDLTRQDWCSTKTWRPTTPLRTEPTDGRARP